MEYWVITQILQRVYNSLASGLDITWPSHTHLEHGAANIRREPTAGRVTREVVFTGKVPHGTQGGVNVLNLVEGEEAIIARLVIFATKRIWRN